jgi:hypothetical protein
MRNRIAALLTALAIPLFAVLGLATPAAAYEGELDYTVDIDWYAAEEECITTTYVTACIRPNGDDIWIKDNVANGYEVWVTWTDTDSGIDRWGHCVDKLGADKAWTYCNKDWPDGHDISWYVNWQLAEDDYVSSSKLTRI